MTLLAAENICKRYDDQVLFDGISFTINSGEKIGLAGRNGIGKTTLFDVLAGRAEIDSGGITRSKQCLINYVTQDKSAYLDLLLFDYVASARQDLLDLRREIAALEEQLAMNPHDKDSLDRLGQMQHTFETEGGFVFENEIKIILEGLGFTPDRHQDRMANFSGGEKNRAALAMALAGRGNLLLLDEPTNHLDIESTMWLEDYISKTDRSCLIVSHDRAFLSATIDRIWDLQFGKLHIYVGGFEKYLVERRERRRLQEHHYRHQQEEIKRIEDFVHRNMAGQKTKQAQSKLKYLSRIKRIEAPRAEGAGPSIEMKSSGRSFAHVLEVRDLALGYGREPVVEAVTFDIYRGEKVGLIGRNGSGKTTLLRALLGELSPAAGEIRLGNNVDVVYFDQELDDLRVDATVLDNIWEVDPMVEAGRMRSFLARFGFSGDDCFKMVGTLSGGERTKLSLAKILYHPANFLIFDEPTNHLDIDSREVLEEALAEFDGTCLIVSHDRHFLDSVVDRVFHVAHGGLSVYNGSYSYYAEKTAEQAGETPVKATKSKDAYLAFKEASKARARIKKAIKSTRSKIADHERELESLEAGIAEGIPRTDWEALENAANRKHEVENELLSLYDTLEQLEEQDDD